MAIPVPIVGQAYADDTLPFAQQECVNWFVEQVETDGALVPAKLRGCSGMAAFATAGSAGHRGACVMDGVLYVVAGTSLYSVSQGAVATSLGTVPGDGRVSMVENGTQLLIVNGTATGYTYTPASATFAAITDSDFLGGVTAAFLNGSAIVTNPDSDEFQLSDLLDFRAWAALSSGAIESRSGDTLAVIEDHGELWFYKANVIERWVSGGDDDLPYERVDTIPQGTAATHSVVATDNRVFWLGTDGVFWANPSSPERISTFAIEQAIKGETLSTCFAMAYTERGHKFIAWTFPSGNGKTWVYDVATRMWHRRKSYEISRWRANTHAFCYGKNLFGDYSNGTIWELSDTTYAEGSDPLIAERKTQYLHNGGEWVSMPELELVFDVGNGLNTGQGSNPLVDFRYSDDGGHSFCDFKQRSLGTTGQYGTRVRFDRLGRFRQRMFHIRVSDPVKRDLLAAVAR